MALRANARSTCIVEIREMRSRSHFPLTMIVIHLSIQPHLYILTHAHCKTYMYLVPDHPSSSSFHASLMPSYYQSITIRYALNPQLHHRLHPLYSLDKKFIHPSIHPSIHDLVPAFPHLSIPSLYLLIQARFRLAKRDRHYFLLNGGS